MAEVKIEKDMKVRINCHVPGHALAEEHPYAKGEGVVVRTDGDDIFVEFPNDKRTYSFHRSTIIVQK